MTLYIQHVYSTYCEIFHVVSHTNKRISEKTVYKHLNVPICKCK